jgi:ATP-binding cassette subfamily B protein
MLQEDVPCEVQELLEDQQLNGVPVLLSTTSDLSLLGQLRKQWIVVTRHNVSIVADGVVPQLVNNVPLSRVEQFRAVGAIGSGFLQAHVDGIWIDLLRHSNALADRFRTVADKLEALRTTGDTDARMVEELEPLYCPKCALRLPAMGESCPRCIPRGATVARLWQLLRPHWPAALAMAALMLVGVAMELVPPKLQQHLVDQILSKGETAAKTGPLMAALLVLVLALAATRVLVGIVAWGKGVLSTRVGVALTSDLRWQLVRKLHALGVGYYDRHQVNSLVNRAVYDSEVVHTLLQQVTGGFLLQIVQVVAVGVMLFTLNPKLALFTLIPAPLVVAGSLYFWRRIYPVYFRYADSSTKQASTLSGMLNGIRVVKAFAQERRELSRFVRSSDALRECRVTVDNANASYSAVMALIFSLGGLIVWYVGGRDVLAGSMTLGSLMAFLAYLAMFYAPLSMLSQLTTWLTSFLTGCHRVFELLDTQVETQEPAEQKSLVEVRGEIRFENVSFGYERHRPVLKNVSFTIQPGQRIGIVGRSGSGKTTLVNLISRFYDVDEGRILLDGVGIGELSTEALRQTVGVVLQEPFLFRGTLFDNLVYGRPEAGREETIVAARAAQTHDFIVGKPLAYDTWVGERGAGLSGGERQRISLARALLSDPRVLILDEATSSVDTESEQAIQDALSVLVRGRTTLAIAHRLSTLRDSDRIFVFDEGRLIEQGTHSELMVLDGTYARLAKIQTQFAQDRQLEFLLNSPETSGKVRAQPNSCDTTGVAVFNPLWLEPESTTLRRGSHDSLEVELGEGTVYRGVVATRCFPATAPDSFISLNVCNRDGRGQEIGLVRDLRSWPADAQEAIRSALAKRYFQRTITAIERIRLQHGYLTFAVQTDQGPAKFTVRWTQSQVQDFGERGKVILDLEDNCFLIPDADALPARQRELLQRFIYW